MENHSQILGTFCKLDGEHQLAFGWAYVAQQDGAQVIDKSGDFIDAEALGDFEHAAYDYVLVSREADEQHVKLYGVAKLVESVFLTPDKIQKMGLSGDRVGWWLGFKVHDPEVWEKVKSGEYPMFSIRGAGVREPVDEAE